MSKQHEAINFFYPGLFEDERLDLEQFLNLPLDHTKNLISNDWFHQRFKLAIVALMHVEFPDIPERPNWDDKEVVLSFLENVCT
tara:strand:+ start:628 stop:879 length:252 start_codon:yes stop_codon:yes gene_type:complete